MSRSRARKGKGSDSAFRSRVALFRCYRHDDTVPENTSIKPENPVRWNSPSPFPKQKPFVVWITGLSGSGKSTVAELLDVRLRELGLPTTRLDGDRLRTGLNSDLGYDLEARRENVRRTGEVARLFFDSGMVVLVSLISPYRQGREAARALFGAGEFLEVFLDTPLEVCESRDPKGLYRKARQGIIPFFTGVSDTYEPPEAPDLRFGLPIGSVDETVDEILAMLSRRAFLGRRDRC